MLDQILNTTEDIVVLNKTKNKIVFAFPFKGDLAEHYFNRTVSNGKENAVEGFKRHWEFDGKIGLIKGSSTFLALRLDEEVRKEGLWIPTPKQAVVLDEKNKLSNKVYRDFGMVVYSKSSPNKEVAKEIISQTGKKLPLIIPFKALIHRLDNGFQYGIAVPLAETPTEIVSGKRAIELLDKFSYKRNSGACRLGRSWDGGWDANWGYLGDSYADGRVDWMCCEATRADLKTAYEGLLKRQYDSKIQKLKTERDEKQADFEKSLK